MHQKASHESSHRSHARIHRKVGAFRDVDKFKWNRMSLIIENINTSLYIFFLIDWSSIHSMEGINRQILNISSRLTGESEYLVPAMMHQRRILATYIMVASAISCIRSRVSFPDHESVCYRSLSLEKIFIL